MSSPLRGLWGMVLLCGLLSSCGPVPPDPESPAPPPTDESAHPAPETESKKEGFLGLRSPQIELPRPPEKPIFHIYYDLDGLPDAWIEEWKGERDLKIEQHPLPGDLLSWPKDADLVIAGPDRLVRERLRPLPADTAAPRANPVFLHHPFDPDQSLTRPWRWTPWVVMHHTTVSESPKPTPPTAPPSFPDRAETVRAWWIKSQGLSVNGPLDSVMKDKWQTQLSLISPSFEPVASLWRKVVSGETASVLLPLAWKLREPHAPVSWTAPAQGTVIHFDHLAIGMDTDQPELALEWVVFLSNPERQKLLLPATGFYPVYRPLGREVPDVTGPQPSWWDRSEFLVGTPPPRKIPVAEVVPQDLSTTKQEVPSPEPNSAVASPADTVTKEEHPPTASPVP